MGLDGAEVAELREAARDAGAGVVVGLAERVDGGVANSAVCIDAAGEVAGVYRKTHPFGEERSAYLAGEELVTVEAGRARARPGACARERAAARVREPGGRGGRAAVQRRIAGAGPGRPLLPRPGPEEERVVSAEIGPPGRRDPRMRYRDLLRGELYGRPR